MIVFFYMSIYMYIYIGSGNGADDWGNSFLQSTFPDENESIRLYNLAKRDLSQSQRGQIGQNNHATD